MRINGSLIFDSSPLSFIRNLRVERLQREPGWAVGDEGRLIYSEDTKSLRIGTDTEWLEIASELDIAEVQGLVDTIVSQGVGAALNADGTFNPDYFLGSGNIVDPVDLSDVLTQLDAAIAGGNTLDEIFPGTDGDVIYNVAGEWQSGPTGATSGVQAHADNLDGLSVPVFAANQTVFATGPATFATTALTAYARTLTATSDSAAARVVLGSVIGTDVQAFDADLSNLAALTPALNDVIVGTGTAWQTANGASARSALGLAIGTDVQAFDADLSTFAGFAPGDSNNFIISTGGAEGARWALTSGAAARGALGLGDIATEDSAAFIRTDGTSTITNGISFNNFPISALAPGVTPDQAVNKQQLDAAVSGLSWKDAVRASTAADIDLAAAPADVDDVTLASGDRVLVRAQTDAAENGIYVFSASGAALTRADDMDAADEFSSATVFVGEGTTYAETGWTQISTVVTVGTDPVNFVQFTGAGTYTAGSGLLLTGNTFSARFGAGVAPVPTGEIGVDTFDPTTSALILTLDGLVRSSDTNAKLHFLANPRQFVQDGPNGLSIASEGIDEVLIWSGALLENGGLIGGSGTKLAVNVDNATIALGLYGALGVPDGGISNQKLESGGLINLRSNNGAQVEDAYVGEDFNFEATSGTGVAVVVSAGNTVTISGLDATDVVKGVASFDAADFIVTNGVVTAVPLDIDELPDVTITNPQAGQVLMYRGAEYGGWTNKPIYKLFQAGSPDTSFTITHDLGQKYCTVTVADLLDDEVVIPQSIKFLDDNNLEVTFNTPVLCSVMIMGVDQQPFDEIPV